MIGVSEPGNIKLPELSNRMKLAADMVSAGSITADIGCDHGYVSIYLYKTGRSSRCIAADVNKGPLQAAKNNIEVYGASGGVEARLSDGLKNIAVGEADCALMLGMGGNLIIKILSEDKKKTGSFKELILEPQSEYGAVRRFLYENGFVITKEAFVSECGKYYPIMRAALSDTVEELSDEEYEYGKCLLDSRDSLLYEYLCKEQNRIAAVMATLEDSDSETARNRLYELKAKAGMIDKAMSKYKKVILASGSPRRKELMAQIGIEIEVIPSGADESTDITEPDKLVEELSNRKCEDVAARIENGIVLGADTVVSIGGEILGKPSDEQNAKEMLKRLSGNTHQVYTGVTIIRRQDGNTVSKVTFSEKTDVSVCELTDAEINEYVLTGEPMDKAGAYGIQGIFARHISGIDGDYFNVVGLPLAAVYRQLKGAEDEVQRYN